MWLTRPAGGHRDSQVAGRTGGTEPERLEVRASDRVPHPNFSSLGFGDETRSSRFQGTSSCSGGAAPIPDVRPTSGSAFLGDKAADQDLNGLTAELEKAQELLFSQPSALLVVLQGLDAAGKDGTIKHVMSGVNPQGCVVTSFKGTVGGGARS